MRIRNTFISTIILLLFAVEPSFGQNTNDIGSLAFKLGSWKWETRGLVIPGDPKTYKGVGYSNVYFINDSTSILDDHKIEWENGIVYRAITYRTYDKVNNNFMVVWAQAETGNTSKIEGHWEGGKFVELSSGTDAYGDWNDRLELFDIEEISHKAKLVRTYKNGYSIVLLEYTATRLDD